MFIFSVISNLALKISHPRFSILLFLPAGSILYFFYDYFLTRLKYNVNNNYKYEEISIRLILFIAIQSKMMVHL